MQCLILNQIKMNEQKLTQLGVSVMSVEEMKHIVATGLIDWLERFAERGVENAKNLQKIYKAVGIDVPLKNIMGQ